MKIVFWSFAIIGGLTVASWLVNFAVTLWAVRKLETKLNELHRRRSDILYGDDYDASDQFGESVKISEQIERASAMLDKLKWWSRY